VSYLPGRTDLYSMWIHIVHAYMELSLRLRLPFPIQHPLSAPGRAHSVAVSSAHTAVRREVFHRYPPPLITAVSLSSLCFRSDPIHLAPVDIVDE